MPATPAPQRPANIQQLLSGLIARFGGAIEFWTVACLSQSELGAPEAFVDFQWSGLLDDLQTIRLQLTESGIDTSPVVQEQLAKLSKSCADLREIFDTFIHFTTASNKELEVAVLRFGQLWEDFRMRIALLGVLLPFSSQIPTMSSEQEAYYRSILDGLFDRFEAARPRSVFDASKRTG